MLERDRIEPRMPHFPVGGQEKDHHEGYSTPVGNKSMRLASARRRCPRGEEDQAVGKRPIYRSPGPVLELVGS